jgi:hypothetical protein
MKQIIPLQPVPNQTLQVQLSNQPIVLNVYQLAYGLFVDVFVGTSLIAAGVICENLNRIVRDAYRGFVGDLAFLDVQTTGGEGSDPVYTGLGTRYLLIYDDAGFSANLG